MSRVLAKMLSTKPYIVQKYRLKKIHRYQRAMYPSSNGEQHLNGDTVLICDFLEMTGNVVWSTPCPKILFQHNIESVIWRRYYENESNWLKKAYFWFEHRRMRRYEISTCNRFDLVLVVSPTDKELLQRDLGVTAPVEVIETGVDVDYFTPSPDTVPVPGRLLFLGSLDWMPNIDGIDWFVQNVYPLIKASAPHATLDIVGAGRLQPFAPFPQPTTRSAFAAAYPTSGRMSPPRICLSYRCGSAVEPA